MAVPIDPELKQEKKKKKKEKKEKKRKEKEQGICEPTMQAAERG